jgi:hypothetical protein
MASLYFMFLSLALFLQVSLAKYATFAMHKNKDITGITPSHTFSTKRTPGCLAVCLRQAECMGAVHRAGTCRLFDTPLTNQSTTVQDSDQLSALFVKSK